MGYKYNIVQQYPTIEDLVVTVWLGDSNFEKRHLYFTNARFVRLLGYKISTQKIAMQWEKGNDESERNRIEIHWEIGKNQGKWTTNHRNIYIHISIHIIIHVWDVEFYC